MLGLRVSYEIGRLQDLVDERRRLVEVLGLTPSKNDTLRLRSQLGNMVELFKGQNASDIAESVKKYNAIVDDARDIVDDVELESYKFEIKQTDPEVSPSVANNDEVHSVKKVRFSDNMVSYKDSTEDTSVEETTFQPYHDYEDSTRGVELAPSNNLLPMASNKELFIEQQQQLLEQDTHLGTLADSVGRTHEMSVDINREIEDQHHTVLYDLENLIDNNGRNLKRAKKRLEIFEKTARANGPCFIIIILVMILLFLIIVL
ncbi:hypothetical protein TPHA_0L00550 [Tetrapisispora phaffii CBS 4417]|uniref:t-SNARE coiled-coil homology domain-containing protein n=1 Tax=Tetrapisispora phaffii (strain ATCC 24235 / CBS 4417 / NBRC 1672 / NRRL Y-8282 / UCD 70-5) TaxID=1071381 RepID=G8BZT3_TETPH|nr:hypothetical protein TPHA_0L00550 [Tetrapisispora phaffii CBS 4417]CCE65411.1 hypothetical protein TPHA_0L00550 [Tetrapisispora phaffii CBS 4417]